MRIRSRRWFIGAVMGLAGCSAKLDVADPERAVIAIAVSAPTISVRVGETSPVLQVSLQRNAAATEPVTLAVTGLPAGVRSTLTPSTLVGSDRTATLELLATATATPGTATLNLRATSGTLSVQATIALTVQPAS